MADEQSQNTGNENTSTQTDGNIDEQKFINKGVDIGFAKGAEKATKDLLASIGVDDIDVLKSIVTTQKEQEEASKSELQKLQELLEEERASKLELENKLNQTLAETEIQNIAIEHGINPKYMKYFKIDYLNSKDSEGFELDKFITTMKEEQPMFFGYVDERVKQNISNPSNKQAPSNQIKMSEYAQLPAKERAKYKAQDIIK